MIIVSGVLTADPFAHALIVEATATMVTATMAEPGCISYGLWGDLSERGRFRIFEEWRDQAALTEHFATPHFAAFGDVLAEAKLSSMDVHRYIDPTVADLF